MPLESWPVYKAHMYEGLLPIDTQNYSVHLQTLCNFRTKVIPWLWCGVMQLSNNTYAIIVIHAITIEYFPMRFQI